VRGAKDNHLQENPVKILITGNLGYVGPNVVRFLRQSVPEAVVLGYDTGYFAHCLTGADALPEVRLDSQTFGDVRDLTSDRLRGIDAIIHLAAISNDPMGDRYAEVTLDINQHASAALARAAVEAGVKHFAFASSCSVYGVASGGPRKEDSPLNPMTTYAQSKIGTEQALAALDTDMVITCLRFATACGMSDRLRLDLVLNDFVAGALVNREITVLSDGTPWRPLIDTADMARALAWAVQRPAEAGGRFLIVNAGATTANYQVRDLAHAVAAAVPGTAVSINTAAPADSRSYQVDFSLFSALAAGHTPRVGLEQSIQQLVDGMTAMNFADRDYRTSALMRLRTLQGHVDAGRIGTDLRWRTPAVSQQARRTA
jgi:nucleoside-diphosphate-sugar epimerase